MLGSRKCAFIFFFLSNYCLVGSTKKKPVINTDIQNFPDNQDVNKFLVLEDMYPEVFAELHEIFYLKYINWLMDRLIIYAFCSILWSVFQSQLPDLLVKRHGQVI